MAAVEPADTGGKIGSRGNRLVAWLFALASLLLIVAVWAAGLTLGSITSDTDRVEHTLQVQTTINRLAAYNERIETGRRGFLIQPNPSFSQVIRNASVNYDTAQAALARLVADNPEQVQRAQRMQALDAERDRLIDAMFAAPDRTRQQLGESDFDAERGVQLTREIRAIADTMAETETDLLSLRNRAQLDSLITFYIVGGIALALLLTVLGAVIVLVLRFNRQLHAAQTELIVANEGLETAVELRTSELSRANQEIQRFAYIVSHDLRSPLVNVLGFVSELGVAGRVLKTYLERLFAERPELRDEQAWLAVDEDIPEALQFIDTSTRKMDRLINSILDLSRLGRRPLNPEMLDMDRMVSDILVSLHHKVEQAAAEVTVNPLPPITSDRIALEQILSNLIENALKYLSAARPGEVTVEGGTEGGRNYYDVIDNGRGIAPEDHERVFELFRRAGAQDTAGDGIGLANVRALAYRLGGSIELTSRLDAGARFRLWLPQRYSPQEFLE